MTNEEARHREAIRALNTRMTIASDRGRFEDVAACYTEDGIARWSSGGGQGRADIAAKLASGAANPDITFVRHHLTTIHIELAPDMMSGTGRVYYFAISNAGWDHGGVYVDRYARVGEEWLFALREVRMDWQAPTSLYPQQETRTILEQTTR